MSKRSAKLHNFERCIQALQTHFGIAQSAWFWMQQFNVVIYHSDNRAAGTFSFPLTGNMIAAKLFVDYMKGQNLSVEENEVCKILHLTPERFHQIQAIIEDLQHAHNVKPLPYEQARYYVTTLQIEEIAPVFRQQALEVFLKYGASLLRKGFKPLLVAFGIYRYLEIVNPTANFRLYRVASIYRVSVSRTYAIGQLLNAQMREYSATTPISSATAESESNMVQ